MTRSFVRHVDNVDTVRANDVNELQSAIETMSPMTTAGDLVVGGASGVETRIPQASQPFINVKAPPYGAAGNGTTDDTAAIAAAIAAVPASGGTVFFPSGTYRITSALTMKSNLHLVGAGQQASQITQATANTAILTGVDIRGLAIADLQINGTGAGTGGGIVLTLSVNPATNYLHFTRLTVYNCGGTGINVQNGIVSTFDLVQVVNCLGHGFWFHGAAGAGAGTSCQFRGCYANNNNQSGFFIDTMTYCEFSACASEGNGIEFDIANCNGIALNGCGTEVTRNVNASYPGISYRLTNVVGCTLSACFVYAGQTHGLWITGNSANIVVLGFEEIVPSVNMIDSIRVDAGSFATLVGYRVATAVSLAANTTQTLDNGAGNMVVRGTFSPVGDMVTQLTARMAGQYSPALLTKAAADADVRFYLDAGGAHYWGAGVSGQDVNLYRNASRQLKTDWQFIAADGVATKTVTSPPTDAAFGAAPAIGTIVVDTVNSKLWVRTGANVYKGVTIA